MLVHYVFTNSEESVIKTPHIMKLWKGLSRDVVEESRDIVLPSLYFIGVDVELELHHSKLCKTAFFLKRKINHGQQPCLYKYITFMNPK